MRPPPAPRHSIRWGARVAYRARITFLPDQERQAEDIRCLVEMTSMGQKIPAASEIAANSAVEALDGASIFPAAAMAARALLLSSSMVARTHLEHQQFRRQGAGQLAAVGCRGFSVKNSSRRLPDIHGDIREHLPAD